MVRNVSSMFVTPHMVLELGALDVGARDLWERNVFTFWDGRTGPTP